MGGLLFALGTAVTPAYAAAPRAAVHRNSTERVQAHREYLDGFRLSDSAFQRRNWGIVGGSLDQFRWPIAAVITLSIIQAALIVALLTERTRRVRAEGEALHRLRLEALLSELSTMFSTVSPSMLNNVIAKALRRVATFTGAARAHLAEINAVSGEVVRMHSSVSGPGVPDGSTDGDPRLARLRARLSHGEILWLHSNADQSELTDAADALFLERGVAPMIVVPLMENGQTTGALALVSDASHDWPPDLADGLPVLGRVFGNALAGRRAALNAVRLREELTHVSRVATMGELAASLAHEINQPLCAILSYTQAASMHLDSARPDLPSVKGIVERIAADDRRATDIIERLRTFLRRQEVTFVPVELGELIANVEMFVRGDARQRRITLRTELDGDLPPICGDSVELQQVLVNLVMNAFDAVASQPVDRRIVTIGIAATDEYVQVVVSDRGDGIPHGQLERIFEPFVTTRERGLGMGLTICRTLISHHQGEIHAWNNDSGGACFTFTIPVAEREPRGPGSTASSQVEA